MKALVLSLLIVLYTSICQAENIVLLVWHRFPDTTVQYNIYGSKDFNRTWQYIGSTTDIKFPLSTNADLRNNFWLFKIAREQQDGSVIVFKNHAGAWYDGRVEANPEAPKGLMIIELEEGDL